MRNLFFFCAFLFLIACKNEKEKFSTQLTEGESVNIEYARGFSIQQHEGFKILTVKDPWPDAEISYSYLLVEDSEKIPAGLDYDHKIKIPVKSLVATSTTHIPLLETLEETNSLTGFPGLDYISSIDTRKRINAGKVAELGKNESINTESLIALEPDVVIGFAVNGNNKTYNTIQRSGIPVLFNGDWTEESPLAKAEWIKFFGALFNKSREAEDHFNEIVKNYEEAKYLAETAENKFTVLSGSMYKDQWYVPYGNSWQAQFIKDANAQYVYEDTRGSGSISMAFETVLSDAEDADFWVAPGQFKSYQQLTESSPHYTRFKAVRDKNVFTYNNTTGETGGVLFFELAPARPDIVLKDYISIFHPQLLPNYEPVFFKPLE